MRLFLDAFLELAPPPAPRSARVDGDERRLVAVDEPFSGFVFKIQANMDPRHRDRVAFLRVCSGRFERDMVVRNVRTGKDVRLVRAMKLFANEREVVDEGFAGDVVGLANPGTFAIGDTLVAGDSVAYGPIPTFTPEHFAAVRNIDTATYKAFGKGVAQLREEGAIQVFYAGDDSMRTEPIFAAVAARCSSRSPSIASPLRHNVETRFTPLPYALARRAIGDPATIARGSWPSSAKLVEAWDGTPLVLFESEWSVRLAEEWNPDVRLIDPATDDERAETTA